MERAEILFFFILDSWYDELESTNGDKVWEIEWKTCPYNSFIDIPPANQ